MKDAILPQPRYLLAWMLRKILYRANHSATDKRSKYAKFSSTENIWFTTDAVREEFLVRSNLAQSSFNGTSKLSIRRSYQLFLFWSSIPQNFAEIHFQKGSENCRNLQKTLIRQETQMRNVIKMFFLLFDQMKRILMARSGNWAIQVECRQRQLNLIKTFIAQAVLFAIN